MSIEATSKVFNKEAMEEWERQVFDLQEQDRLMTGGVSFVDDTPKKIRHAVLDKWKQARAARKPVLIAVDASHMGTRRSDDFDVALYGSTVMQLGIDRQPEGNYYEPDGVLSTDTGPTVDGVLAFMDVQITHAADPILYRNPNSAEPLPEAILGLTQRTFGPNGPRWQPATGEPIMRNLPWAEWGDDPEEQPP